MAYPVATDNLQHEVERSFALAAAVLTFRPGVQAPRLGWTCGIDRNPARDLAAKGQGEIASWDMGKGFDKLR